MTTSTAIPENMDIFRIFFEKSDEAILVLENGIFIDCNAAAVRLMRAATKTDLLSVHPSRLSPEHQPDGNLSIEKADEMIHLALENGNHRFEWVHRRLDGEDFPVEVILTAIQIGDRQVLQTIWRDITKRKQIETQLNQNITFTRTLLDAVPTPIFYKDKEGRYQGCNRAFTAIMGKTAEDIRGKTVHQLWPSENAEVYHQKDLELMRSPSHQVYESVTKDKDGNTRPVIFAKDVFMDGSGNVAGLVGAFIDISERKQSEEEMLRLKNAIEQTGDGIALADLSGNILYANPAWANMHGYTTDEILGKSLSIFHTGEQLEREVLPFNEKAMEIGSNNGEIGHMRKDGTTFPTLMTVAIQKDESGKPVGLIGTARDISENKRLEREIQQAFERRGYQVQISNEISQEVAAAAELEELLKRVVTLTKERLGYYHTQILRYSVEQDAVVLIHGYGETGQKMLAGGHKMPMGSGLIGTAAASGITVMRPTLADDPDWKPNPLLPETRGEIAIPIKWQGSVLGVLDVQSNTASALTEDDRLLLESLCGQIAVAIHSAELLEELRVSRERYELSVAGSNDGLWDWDMSTNAVYFSPRWKEMIGYGEGELNNGFADFESLLHSEDHDRVLAHVNDYLSGKVPNYNIEFRFRHKDGSYRWILARGVVVRNAEGAPLRMAGSHTDITERRKIQENMVEALEVARLANWEYDVEKDLFTFNDQFYSIFHTTAEKVGGYQITSAQYAGMFVYPEDAPLVGAEIGKALNAPERVYNKSLDHRILYADGGIGYITVKVTVERDENGKITRFYGANQEITDRKLAEEALQRSRQDMAERLEEINRLYQTMSREGWQAYRTTTDLPAGFMFDQDGTKPVEGITTPAEGFTNIPMKVLGGEVVGNLAVANDPEHPITKDDLDFLQQVSDQVALALEGARLSAQTQSALAQTEKLSEVGLRMNRAADLQELVQIVADALDIPVINRAALETFTYNAANEVTGMDVIANWWSGVGNQPTAVGTHYTAEILPLLSLFLTATPNYIADAFHDERVDEISMQIIKRLNVRAVAVLPLFLADRQLGVLLLEAEQPYEFTQDDIRLFTAMGPQLSTVLENRRQYERAQKQAERESALNLISQKIQAATTVEAVLQIAARELGHALGAPMTIAQLSMKDRK